MVSDIEKTLADVTDFFTKNTSKSQLKKYGQYFTVDKCLLSALFDGVNFHDDIEILEPSSGTGTIIFECIKHLGSKIKSVTGVEIDENLVDISSNIFKKFSNVEVIHDDFLKKEFDKKYDLIIGNPPYGEIKKGDYDHGNCAEISYGRMNIYSLFIYKSIKLLKDNGQLCFILPHTFLSGKYFEKVRKYVVSHCEILDIIKFNKNNMFDKALQSVIILKLRKTSVGEERTNNFLKYINGNLFFVKDVELVDTNLENSKSIHELGCRVKTGSVVWNQHKENINERSEERQRTTGSERSESERRSERSVNSVSLVFSSDLSTIDNELSTKKMMIINDNTRQFVQSGPCIFINRIVGSTKKKLNVVLFTGDVRYCVENHVNVISGDIDNLRLIHESLKRPLTLDFIQEILGSTQLSKHELENIIPIKV